MFAGISNALSHRNYRLYAMGHVAHVHGWWGNRLGIGWLTWQLTGSPVWLGIITLAGMLPVMVISPLAGAVADRYGHRTVAMVSGAAGFLVTITLSLLAMSGIISLPGLVLFTIAQGLIFGLEFPARQALIPQLVGKSNIAAAVAFNSTTFQLGFFLGPVLAAGLISKFNPGASILLYGTTNLWMLVMLGLIRMDRAETEKRSSTGLFADMREGFRYVAGEKALIPLLLITLTTGFFLRPYMDLLPGFSADVFARGPEGLGALTSASGLGALTVALWMLTRSRTQGLLTITNVAAILASLSLIGFSQTPGFILALPVLAFVSGSLIATQVAAYSLVQTVARADMRGRVISINISILMGAPALGALSIGWLAGQIGLSNGVAAAGGLALVALGFVIPAVNRRRKDIELAAGTGQ